MFCPKCGSTVNQYDEVCPKCKTEIPDIPAKSSSKKSNLSSTDEGSNKTLGYAVATIIFLLSFYGAHSISAAGTAISEIQSVGGQTLEEAYYFELGGIYSGLANMARATGIFFSSLIVLITNKR